MDWILFIFKGPTKHYLVPGESSDAAWSRFALRQSMSLDNCKKQYTMLGHMNANSVIWKI